MTTSIYHIGCADKCPRGIDPADTSGSTRTVTLRFLRSELLYDISNGAYVESHVMNGDQDEHGRHMVADICEKGNVDRVTRIMDAVVAAATEMLYPYTKQAPIEEGESVDDRMAETGEYEIEMHVPLSFSRTTLQLLSKLVHEFLVSRVLHDWLSTTRPEAAERWLAKALEAQGEIDEIKNMRSGTLTRPMRPF